MSKTFPFQAIQFTQTIHFSISMLLVLFNPSIGPLSVATTPGQSRPGSDGNEEVLCILQKLQYCWNLTIRLFIVISRTLVGWGCLTPLQRCSQCILQPQLTGQQTSWDCSKFNNNNCYKHQHYVQQFLFCLVFFILIFISLARSKYVSIIMLLFAFYAPRERQNPRDGKYFFLLNNHLVFSSNQNLVIRLHLKISLNFMHLYLKEGFWLVGIPFCFILTL